MARLFVYSAGHCLLCFSPVFPLCVSRSVAFRTRPVPGLGTTPQMPLMYSRLRPQLAPESREEPSRPQPPAACAAKLKPNRGLHILPPMSAQPCRANFSWASAADNVRLAPDTALHTLSTSAASACAEVAVPAAPPPVPGEQEPLHEVCFLKEYLLCWSALCL